MPNTRGGFYLMREQWRNEAGFAVAMPLAQALAADGARRDTTWSSILQRSCHATGGAVLQRSACCARRSFVSPNPFAPLPGLAIGSARRRRSNIMI